MKQAIERRDRAEKEYLRAIEHLRKVKRDIADQVSATITSDCLVEIVTDKIVSVKYKNPDHDTTYLKMCGGWIKVKKLGNATTDNITELLNRIMG